MKTLKRGDLIELDKKDKHLHRILMVVDSCTLVEVKRSDAQIIECTEFNKQPYNAYIDPLALQVSHVEQKWYEKRGFYCETLHVKDEVKKC